VVNGPISPTRFDSLVGTGTAASSGFVHGYDVTYNSIATNESVESTLLTFNTPADAAAFLPAIVDNAGASNLSPRKSTLAGIPGSILLTGTIAGSDNFYVTDVLARKGSTVMMIEYSNDAAPVGLPDVVTRSALQQYSLAV
jgi:hypothetical protein